MGHRNYVKAIILLGSLSLTTLGQAADDQPNFPGETWQLRTPSEAGLDPNKLNEFAKAVGGDGVVIRDGYLVKTWGQPERRADWASSAKPVISTLLLFAVREGKLQSVDDPVRPWVRKHWPGKDLIEKDRTMTFRHLADMTSGYTRGEVPGSHWAYNDLAINLYQSVLGEVLGESLKDAALKRLAPLRLEDGDLFGSRGGAGVNTSPRDFARVGWFWLNQGNWSGKQLLAASYFEKYMQPDVPRDLPRTKQDGSDYLGIGSYGGGNDQDFPGQGVYGFNWWFNAPMADGEPFLPNLPDDAFCTIGHQGNEVMLIVPSWKLVVAARGNWGGVRLKKTNLLREAVLGQDLPEPSRPASGPLRVHAKNPRYFSDASGRAVLLTGSHMWNNLVDMGRSDPPESFDFAAYLNYLERYGHNFIRLWTWDSATWDTRANRGLGKDFVHHVAPLPWARVGSGKALDGKPKFDLTQFDPAYFDRLRQRVSEAGQRGIYVSVMLFEGWELMHGNRGRAAPTGWAWRGHPFHPDNNINGIDAGVEGDRNSGKPHSLGNGKVNAIQAAYIRQVVDTVNDLDNVLYEVINEGGEKEWDWWVVETVREHERGKPKQHPIGITGHGAERLASMLASPADWLSPGRNDGFAEDPPAWDGKKVSLLDTDHVWGIGGNQAWVWKGFLRGHNPLFMDPYDGAVLGKPFDPQWEPIRRSMGFARRLAQRVDLAAMTPQNSLSSTQYCLAALGSEYLVYLPGGGKATVDLSQAQRKLAVEWLECATGNTRLAEAVDGGAVSEFTSPFAGDTILYLIARP